MNSILKPSTGTNHYYAKKHGEPIRNVLDNVLAGWCESYQPTGATNSLDAAEMLFKGTQPDFSRPARSSAPEAPAPKEYAPQPADFGSTFGTSRATPRVETAPAPAPEPAPLDMEWTLAPGHGWSAQDSQRQLQALRIVDSKDVKKVISTGFDNSTRLDESSFRKGGWAAGLMTASAIAGVAAFAVASPVVGLALAGGAVVGVFQGINLMGESKQDHNNSGILRDMATRLHEASYSTTRPRPEGHGNYLADFNLAALR